MSQSDLGNTARVTSDISNFPKLADRLQQGLLDELFLGRVMIDPERVQQRRRVPRRRAPGSVGDRHAPPLLRRQQPGRDHGRRAHRRRPDFTRAALGVAAMRYSLLLPRSVDFDQFAALLYPNYPDELTRPLFLSLIQMLWDRGEPNGYAHRMTTNPLPDTPAHKVLINVALGDHQVSNFASDVEARTIGASTHAPVLDPGRWPDDDVLFGVPRITSYPVRRLGGDLLRGHRPRASRSEIPAETIGVPPPPFENVPNREGEDPHGAPRGAPLAEKLISGFLQPYGAVTNVCGGEACHAGGWTGPGYEDPQRPDEPEAAQSARRCWLRRSRRGRDRRSPGRPGAGRRRCWRPAARRCRRCRRWSGTAGGCGSAGRACRASRSSSPPGSPAPCRRAGRTPGPGRCAPGSPSAAGRR